MSYGGAYANRGGYDYHQRRDRINEEEVPESKHTIFIRGLPGDMSTDEIREYFEDRIGPVSFDFVKTSADQQRLFVAVRFETRDDAKEAMSKYSDGDLLGHRCELTWFKDIRRYAQYQSMNQNMRGRTGYRNRSYQQSSGRGSGRESYKRRHSDRDDDRSRSRSRGRSSSDSRSPSVRSPISSRSRSRSSDRGANDDRDRRSVSHGTNSDREKGKDGDPEKKRAKKEKKHRKSKKKRSRTASHSSSEGRSSTPEQAIFGRHAPAGDPVSPNQEETPATPQGTKENTEPEPPFPPPMAPVPSAPVRLPIRINTPANVISNTSFTIGIESDELPRRVLRMSPSAPVVTPPSVAAQEEERLLQDSQQEVKPNVMASMGLPPPPCPPLFNSEKRTTEAVTSKLAMQTENNRNHLDESPMKTAPAQPSAEPASSRSLQNDAPSNKPVASRFPTSSRYFSQFKEIQASLIKTVKTEPKPDEGAGGLRLSSLAIGQQDSDEEKRTVREKRLSNLNEISLERFLVRKKKLEESFRGDCQTYAFVAKKLIEKDPSLEQPIRIALIESMEDLEKQVYEQVDAYLDTICD
nr:RNA recognition motif domain containing protein [Haemonchus contortus]